MSTSPLPPDPYEALGIDKDAEPDAIKKAHRKLVLKHHPDRIKDPALVEQNKNEFQKVQQAYEILIDPAKRSAYDDQVKLAQLRRERMVNQREAPRPTYTRTTYAARPSPAPTQPMPRETPRPEARYAFEERTPDSYFDPLHRQGYEEPAPRTSARKYDSPYEKSRPSLSKPAEKKERSKDKLTPGMAARIAAGMKGAAQSAKTKVQEKQTHVRNAKARDQEERRDRNDKHTYTRYTNPAVDDYSSESSDSDTVVTAGRRRDARDRSPVARPRSPARPRGSTRDKSPRPMARDYARPRSPPPTSRDRRARDRSPVPRSNRQPSVESPRRRQPSPRRDQSDYSSGSEDTREDQWERRHDGARSYIAQSQSEAGKGPTPVRPGLVRQNTADRYWTGEDARDHRRSGSDSDKRRSDSAQHHPRRTAAPSDTEARRPPLQPHASAPAGVKAAARAVEREHVPTRSRQGSYDARAPSSRIGLYGEMPAELKRTSSDPVPPRTLPRHNTMPIRGSTLKQSMKQTEPNHDSGYGTSSGPHTPEMQEHSPTRERESRARETTTKYRAKKDEEDTPRARKVPDEGNDLRRFLSPEDMANQYTKPDERPPRRSSRSREREARSSSTLPEATKGRPSLTRAESSARFEDRPRGKMSPRSPERSASYSRKVDYGSASFSQTKSPLYSSYNTTSRRPLHQQQRKMSSMV